MFDAAIRIHEELEAPFLLQTELEWEYDFTFVKRFVLEKKTDTPEAQINGQPVFIIKSYVLIV